MANKGLKGYTKQISQTIGEVAKGVVNVNKEDANLHIIIPIIETEGPNRMDLSLIYSYYDKENKKHFGKGCSISTYKEFTDNETYIRVREADGSGISYWDDKGNHEFKTEENNITIWKHVKEIPGDSEEYSYEFKDQEGNRIWYRQGNTYYPTSIEYANGEKTIFDGLNMDNGHGEKITFSETGRNTYSRATYTQDGMRKKYVDFEYDTSERITGIKQYKENKLVKHISITYGTNEMVVKDEISKDYAKYIFREERVNQIVEVVNERVETAVKTTIAYEDGRTTLTDHDGRKVYIYFDKNNFPLFEIDEDGNAVETEYDKSTKRLVCKSSNIPTKHRLTTLSTPNISNFSKGSGITTSIVSVGDSVLSEVLGTVYKVSGTGSLSYTIHTKGLGSDTITAVIWGRQKTAYTGSSKVKVTLTADGKDIDEFKKTTVDDNFDMMTLGITAVKSYSTITLTITLTGNASIELGGIQVLKKDYGAFYQYDEQGNVTESESGKGSVTHVYNTKGLQTKSVGKDSAMYDYKYDDKGNMKEAKTAFGGKIENSYDTYNNLTKSVVSNAAGTKKLETKTTYDSKGRHILSQSDELGNTTNYEYDNYGRIQKIRDALNATTEYSYDAFDNLTKILFNNSVSVNYTYDSQNKIDTATLPNGTIYSFGYDLSNNLKSVSMNGTLLVTFTYDQTTGFITHQKYGTNGDSYEFIYNTKHNISQIKINGSLKYQYVYDNFDQLIQVKNAGSTVLKTYTYNNDGQLIKAVEGETTIEYGYDSLGEVNQRKRSLENKTIYESMDSISRSKGFSPENIIGYLQGNNDFLGTIFNGDADIKNPSYSCKPYNYKTNMESKPEYARINRIPCIVCSLTNPMSYNPPSTPYTENSGCIGFWFYPTSTPTSKKYLIYTKASSSNIKSHVAVYQNSTNELVLELKENSGTLNYVTTNTKVQLQQWNFFGLNFRYRDDGQGYAKVFSYELYLNAELKKGNLSNKTIMTDGGLYHIGYRFDGTAGYEELGCKITGLMIGCRTMITTKQMQEYHSISKDYILGNTYLDGNSVDFSATSTHNLSADMLNQFEIYPLQNSVESLRGKKPEAYDVRRVSSTDKDRSFNYNNKIKRYAYVADEGRLEYALNMSSDGSVIMRAFIREDVEKQYFFELKDKKGNSLGLYREKEKYLCIKHNSRVAQTTLQFSTSVWHTIGLSFKTGTVSNSMGGTQKNVTARVYLDGQSYSTDIEDISFEELSLSVGRMFDNESIKDSEMGNYTTKYPLLGQIEMLATRPAYCEVTTLNTLSNELKDTTKISEYDELGMLQKKVVRHKDVDIVSTTYSYKKRSTSSIYHSSQIEKETIKYGYSTASRNYTTDKLGNVTAITDTTFGSHTYTYNARGYLIKEDNTEYAYDNNGNITKAGSTTFTYDTTIKDRLKSVNGKEITYGTNPLNPTSYNGNTYTFEGRRLVKYNGYTYSYNDQGLRTSKSITNVTTKYYYDGDKLITEYTSSSKRRLDFLYDENDILYGFIYNNSNKYFYIRDFMQNIVGIVDNGGSLMVKYEYTAYGRITSITGTLASTIGTYNPFRYKGYYCDTESDMYYCKTRYYVPAWCRWLNADHIAYLDFENINGMNLFVYCKNNPIMYVDEEGDIAISIGFAIACGLVALFAMVSVAVTKPEISSGLVSDIESGLKSFGDFIVKSVTETIVMTSLPYMLTFVALDNVMLNRGKDSSEGYYEYYKPHSKNRNPNNLPKHERGERRKKKDHRGEKGDSRRSKRDKRYKIPKIVKQFFLFQNCFIIYF
ncbi:MAG: hypothetical protein K2P14_01985 [Anaeroplasmataceae bacterium]|nr:hypothetical protein [Anaeroplasmataceae bacterium]